MFQNKGSSKVNRWPNNNVEEKNDVHSSEREMQHANNNLH